MASKSWTPYQFITMQELCPPYWGLDDVVRCRADGVLALRTFLSPPPHSATIYSWFHSRAVTDPNHCPIMPASLCAEAIAWDEERHDRLAAQAPRAAWTRHCFPIGET